MHIGPICCTLLSLTSGFAALWVDQANLLRLINDPKFGLIDEVLRAFTKPTSALGLHAPWCLRSAIEVAGPPSAALH